MAEALESTKIAGRPIEYFDAVYEPLMRQRVNAIGASNFDFLRKIIAAATTPNGWCGIKAHWFQLQHFANRLAGDGIIPHRDAIHHFMNAFPNIRCIWLRRRDRLRQAISYARATQSDVWWQIPNMTPPAKAAPSFDPRMIDDRLTNIEQSEKEWGNFFTSSGIDPMTVWYEDFVNDYRQTIHNVMEFIGINTTGIEIAPPRMQKQADSQTDRWVSLYSDCKGLAPASFIIH